jgi:hypothetical protein
MNSMYRNIDPEDDSFLKDDEIYQRIVELLDSSISNMDSEDKELMLNMLSNCYHKYHNSIRAKSKGNTELIYSTIMALSIEQSKEIERLGSLAKSR